MRYIYEKPSRYPGVPRYAALEMPRPVVDDGVVEGLRERQLAMLQALSDMAMDLAESAYRRARAQDEAMIAAAEAGACSVAPGFDGEDADAEAGAERRPRARAQARAEASVDDQIEALKGAVERAAASAAGGAGDGIPARADPSLVFARLSRVVFQALALERQIAADMAAEAAAAEAAVDHTYDPEMTPERKAKIMERWELLRSRKNTIVRVFKATIIAQRPDQDAEACAIILNDKLLEFERFEVLNRTIWDNVLRHAEPLGLRPVWDDWAHEPWAIAEKDGELEWDHNPYRDRSP